MVNYLEKISDTPMSTVVRRWSPRIERELGILEGICATSTAATLAGGPLIGIFTKYVLNCPNEKVFFSATIAMLITGSLAIYAGARKRSLEKQVYTNYANLFNTQQKKSNN